jgi:hypothetical protein
MNSVTTISKPRLQNIGCLLRWMRIVKECFSEHVVGERRMVGAANGKHDSASGHERLRDPLEYGSMVHAWDMKQRVPADRALAYMIERVILQRRAYPPLGRIARARHVQQALRLIHTDDAVAARNDVLRDGTPGATTGVQDSGALCKAFQQQIDVMLLAAEKRCARLVPPLGDVVVRRAIQLFFHRNILECLT